MPSGPRGSGPTPRVYVRRLVSEREVVSPHDGSWTWRVKVPRLGCCRRGASPPSCPLPHIVFRRSCKCVKPLWMVVFVHSWHLVKVRLRSGAVKQRLKEYQVPYVLLPSKVFFYNPSSLRSPPRWTLPKKPLRQGSRKAYDSSRSASPGSSWQIKRAADLHWAPSRCPSSSLNPQGWAQINLRRKLIPTIPFFVYPNLNQDALGGKTQIRTEWKGEKPGSGESQSLPSW